MTQAPATPSYVINGSSTNTPGRVLLSARDQHLVVDGPAGNGCPGEAIGPAELFLGGVASCGVELIQVLARQQNVPLTSIHCTIAGYRDPDAPPRQDVSLFNKVDIKFDLAGVSHEQGNDLVERFKRR
jgi:uncharacterized OsmC-like protein